VFLVSFAGALLAAAWTSIASPVPPGGQVIDNVACRAASCNYTLYLPSGYRPDRQYPLLLGFHFEANGNAIVERYRAAAEQYGYIVAASNDSRNGSWAASTKVAQAMVDDVMERVSFDPARVYLTGLSGGSRLALQIAQGNRKIAGVIASSAGYIDSQPRSSLRFPVFATVGRLDFNYTEMRRMTEALKSPHRLAVFEGGHVLPPDDVAMQAIEWLELQAMASGLRPRDESVIDAMWSRAIAAIDQAGETARAVHLSDNAIQDFRTLRDTAPLQTSVAALRKIKTVSTELGAEQRRDRAEADLIDAIVMYEVGLADPANRDSSLSALRSLVSDLRRRAVATPSVDRDVAARVLDLITYAPANRVRDQDYLAILLPPPPRR
jgi:predicted esterase